MEKQEWLTQVKRGILEYSILLLISKKEMYGYDLITDLGRWSVLATAEGTIYPLLRRLEKEDLIVSSWRDTVPGVPPRKYYSLTAHGAEMLGTMNDEWQNFITAIDEIKTSEDL